MEQKYESILPGQKPNNNGFSAGAAWALCGVGLVVGFLMGRAGTKAAEIPENYCIEYQRLMEATTTNPRCEEAKNIGRKEGISEGRRAGISDVCRAIDREIDSMTKVADIKEEVSDRCRSAY